jgi:hypothetical protein
LAFSLNKGCGDHIDLPAPAGYADWRRLGTWDQYRPARGHARLAATPGSRPRPASCPAGFLPCRLPALPASCPAGFLPCRLPALPASCPAGSRKINLTSRHCSLYLN